MQWHPTLSTLLMVACEDDMSPVIQLWDLRSAAAMTPAKELLGHNKVGLISIALYVVCPNAQRYNLCLFAHQCWQIPQLPKRTRRHLTLETTSWVSLVVA